MSQLDEERRRLFDFGAKKWARVRLGYAEFSRHLEQLGYAATFPTYAEDVYLCCACSVGGREPQRVLEEAYATELAAVGLRLTSFANGEAASDQVRYRLFNAAPPLVARYRGRFPLGAWLRVAALQAVRNPTEQRAPFERHDDGPALGYDPQQLLRRLDGRLIEAEAPIPALFEAALADAFASLGRRDRALMRLYLTHDVSIRILAQTFGMTGASVARRITMCSEQLLRKIRSWAGHRSATGEVACPTHDGRARTGTGALHSESPSEYVGRSGSATSPRD